jgi:hypothetical protein
LNPSQNNDDERSRRQSKRIMEREARGPYSRVTGGGGGGGGDEDGNDLGAAAAHGLRDCPRNGTKHKKKKGKQARRGQGRRGQGRISGEEEEQGWDETDSPAGNRNVEAEACEVVSRLSQGMLSNVSDASVSKWIQSLKALVEGRRWDHENGAFVLDSLESLLMRCQRSVEMTVGLEFVTMVNMLQLTAKTVWYVVVVCGCPPSYTKTSPLYSLRRIHNLSVRGVFEKFIKGTEGAPQSGTFRAWVANGSKYATFAGAGG